MTTWSNSNKNASTYSSSTKNNATYTAVSRSGGIDFILLEDGFYILTESGDKILLDQSTGQTPWDTLIKS